MINKINIFFSWQTDTDQNNTKQFLLRSLKKAKADLDGVVDVTISEDMRDQSGAQDIADTVLKSIDKCNIFVADLTIVNKYTKEKKEVDKATPNPNVMYELGYAVKTLGWDNIICVANTNYGQIEEMPFDINHHSIIRFCNDDTKNKDSVSVRLVKAIKKTVTALIQKGDSSKNDEFEIGGFDFNNNKVVPVIVPVDTDSIKESFLSHYVDVIKTLFERIKNIVLPTTTNNVTLSGGKQILSLIGKYEQNNRTKCGIPESHKKTIIKSISELLNESVDESFFELGNLESSIVSYGNHPPLYGTEEEKEKYHLIDDLLYRISQYTFAKHIFDLLKGYRFYPMAIKNISGKADEDIELSITSKDKAFVNPLEMFDQQDISLLSDFAYQSSVFEQLFALKTNPFISSRLSFSNIDLSMPFGEERDMSSDEFIDYLESFLCVPEKNEYCKIYIDSLRSKECVWCPTIIVCSKDANIESFSINIISKHSSGDFSSTIKVE